MTLRFMTRSILIVSCCIFIAYSASCQTFGVRAGLNYSKFNGPVEQGVNMDESYGFSNGFHFGISYANDFTDLFSLRFEFLYVQNGSTYSYSGDSYYVIRQVTPALYERGILDYNIDVSNAYLSIPIVANYRINKKWEVFAGPYVNILVGPTGRGELRFESFQRPEDITFRQSLDHSYNNDDFEELVGTFLGSLNDIGIFVDGDVVTLPRFAGGYSQLGEKPGNKYNPFDVGLTGGFHYFLNNGFFIGAQLDYGFLDITNNDVDISVSRLNEDNTFIFSNDRDTHLGIHASFGFRF